MSTSTPRPIRVRPTTTLVIDPDAWALVYGIEGREEIVQDVLSWAHNLLIEAARENGVLADPESPL